MSDRMHDLQQRVRELQAVRNALWPDRDDPGVLSELTPVLTRLTDLKTELRMIQSGANPARTEER